MIEVFVINLESDRERRESITGHLTKLGLPFRIWQATDGNSLDASKFDHEPLDDGVFVCDFTEWSKNEAACGVSHIRLLRNIVNSSIEWAVILEDDCAVRFAFPLDITEWDVPEDAELILLHARATPGKACKSGKYTYAEVLGGTGAEGYLISLAGAQKLVEILNPLKDPVDFQMYSHFRSIQETDVPPYYWQMPRNPGADHIQLQAYVLEPNVIIHTGQTSRIGEHRHPRARFYCMAFLTSK